MDCHVDMQVPIFVVRVRYWDNVWCALWFCAIAQNKSAQTHQKKSEQTTLRGHKTQKTNIGSRSRTEKKQFAHKKHRANSSHKQKRDKNLLKA